jgi:DtxR family Mn-dependent transcriptional regulator
VRAFKVERDTKRDYSALQVQFKIRLLDILAYVPARKTTSRLCSYWFAVSDRTMPSLTVENYIKTIYQLSVDSGGRSATTGKIADSLGVLPGTVTSMLKTLSDNQLATYTPYAGVRLTESGKSLALKMLRRHRLIELFLVQSLGMSWDEVHEEAENMEHAVSDKLISRLEKYLGYPQVDPHGDPIPREDGSLETPQGRSLAGCAQGERFCLIRVLDQSPEFLQYLSKTGLALGAEGSIRHNHLEAGVVTVEVDETETTMGREAASKIFVTPL